MFPGGKLLTTHNEIKKRFAWFVCPGPHVFMCALLCCVFAGFCVYIWTKQDSWERWICFLFPFNLLVAPQNLKRLLLAGDVRSPLCLCCWHISSTPLAGVLPPDCRLWDLVQRSHHCAIIPFFPPSLFPTLRSHFPQSSALGLPHLRHIRVFMLQRCSPRSS